MGRRARIIVLVVVGVAAVLVGGGYAVLALTGDDAPPPPRLQGTPAQDVAAPEGGGRWAVTGGGFVGYRVDEEYLGASEFDLDGLRVRVLPLARVIVSKRAANRPKDLAQLPILEAALAARESKA